MATCRKETYGVRKGVHEKHKDIYTWLTIDTIYNAEHKLQQAMQAKEDQLQELE